MVVGLLFWLAVAGFILDWRYVRRGGVRPTAEERRGLMLALSLFLITFIVFVLMGAPAKGLGSLTGLILPLIFFLWEFRRWRVRKKFPRGNVAAAPF